MSKPQAVFLDTHVMVLSDAASLAPHAHLATQLTISLSGPASWTVDEQAVVASAIYIDGGIKHHCLTAGDYLSFLFMKTGSYAYDAQQHLLKEQPFAILDEDLDRIAREHVDRHADDLNTLSDEVLKACGLSAKASPRYDDRIQNALKSLEHMENIPPNAPKLLSEEACLSQSRFSHLFKQETGMTLASYLAFQKLRKTYQGLREGKSITQAAMDAGFSSPSHCAASCTRMFGISLKSISLQ